MKKLILAVLLLCGCSGELEIKTEPTKNTSLVKRKTKVLVEEQIGLADVYIVEYEGQKFIIACGRYNGWHASVAQLRNDKLP